MKQYTLADIKTLQERQQTAHRGRSIYSDMRSISEDQFRNALENDALPMIKQLLEVIEKQHEALEAAYPHIGAQLTSDMMENAMALASPFIERNKHQQRLRREEGEERSR